MADIRVCFSKMGRLQYISHLDLQRALNRMLLRSGLPIGYSEGFNPHPKLNIALPLSIYQEGERELFDFRITEDIPLDIVAEKLKSAAFTERGVWDTREHSILWLQAFWLCWLAEPPRHPNILQAIASNIAPFCVLD